MFFVIKTGLTVRFWRFRRVKAQNALHWHFNCADFSFNHAFMFNIVLSWNVNAIGHLPSTNEKRAKNAFDHVFGVRFVKWCQVRKRLWCTLSILQYATMDQSKTYYVCAISWSHYFWINFLFNILKFQSLSHQPLSTNATNFLK